MATSPPGRARRWLPRVALATASVLFVLGVLEIALRVLQPYVDVYNPVNGLNVSDPDLGWIPTPGLTSRLRRVEYDAPIEHTAEGFRRPEPEPPAGAAHAALFLGDSFAYGVGVGQGELFTDHLQRAFGGAAAVVNRGVIAYGTAQEFILLRKELERRRYERIGVLFYHNDLDNNVNGRDGKRPFFELAGDELVPRNQPALPIRNPVDELLRWSRLRLLLTHRWDIFMAMRRQAERGDVAPGVAEGPPIDYRTLGGYAVTRRLLIEMDRLARAHGAELYVVFVPLEGQLDRLPSREPYARAVLEMLESFEREDGVRLVDLSPALHALHSSGTPVHFPVDYHWNATGHRAAAEALLRSSMFAGWPSARKISRR